MSQPSRIERRQVFYSGHVQGVGFRYTARGLAREFNVSGFVRNLRDGRVELLVEGEPRELNGFLAEISRTMGHYIRDVQVELVPATGDFDGFDIRF